jgi:hypothetical protein
MLLSTVRARSPWLCCSTLQQQSDVVLSQLLAVRVNRVCKTYTQEDW